MSLRQYLLIPNQVLFIRKIVEKETCPNQVRIEEEILGGQVTETQSNLNIVEFHIRYTEDQISPFIGGYFDIRGNIW